MFESKSGILVIAGLGFFALAFLSNGVVPMLMYRSPEQTVAELVREETGAPPFWTIMGQLRELEQKYSEQFDRYYPGGVTEENAEAALRQGHQVYVAEACWHCHSQFVRPVSGETKRWGPVARSKEYQNELQRPVLFGTRRVGPDLSREGGRRTVDWHATHFYKPVWTSPESVMPEYPWLFDGDPGKPNRRGLGLILYMQWLGSSAEGFPYFRQTAEGGNP